MNETAKNPKSERELTLGARLSLENHFRVRFEQRGIYAYGYGNLYVCSIVDDRLTIRDKGILAYFTSHCGDNGLCTCAQKTILRALKITDHSFEQSIHRLIEYGYVIRERQFYKGKFGQYIYGIFQNPNGQTGWFNLSNYTPSGLDVSFHAPFDRFGAVSKLIMHDPRLSVKEKAFYAAICALSGSEHDLICHRNSLAQILGICPDAASKYTSKLISLGLLARQNISASRKGRGPSQYSVIITPEEFPYPKSFAAQDQKRILAQCQKERVDIEDVNSILGRTLGKGVDPFQSARLAQAAKKEEQKRQIESAEQQRQELIESRRQERKVAFEKEKESDPAAFEMAIEAVQKLLSFPCQIDGLEIRDGRTRAAGAIDAYHPKSHTEALISQLQQQQLSNGDRHTLKMLAYAGIPYEYSAKGNFASLKQAICDCFQGVQVTSNEDTHILHEIMKSVQYLSSERRTVIINGKKNNPVEFLRKFNYILRNLSLPTLIAETIKKVKRAIYTGGVRYLPGYINYCVVEMVETPAA